VIIDCIACVYIPDMVNLIYHLFKKGNIVNKQKPQSGFAHLAAIVIIIVALLGTLGFVYWMNFIQPKVSEVKKNNSSVIIPVTKKPVAVDPMADWKTYTNAQYGFSFKYPADWTVKESPTEKSNKIATPTPTIEAINPNGCDIRIFIYKIGIGGWGFEGNYGSINYDAKLKAGQIVLTGRDYYNGDGSRMSPDYPNQESLGYLIQFSFEFSGYNYMFVGTGEGVKNMDSEDIIFNQIISTWKFN